MSKCTRDKRQASRLWTLPAPRVTRCPDIIQTILILGALILCRQLCPTPSGGKKRSPDFFTLAICSPYVHPAKLEPCQSNEMWRDSNKKLLQYRKWVFSFKIKKALKTKPSQRSRDLASRHWRYIEPIQFNECLLTRSLSRACAKVNIG